MRPFTIAVIAGLIGGLAGSLIVLQIPSSPNRLIAEFYATENAVHVSPHSLRTKMAKGDASFTLVDLRSAEEYEREHIAGAINIPAYSDPNTSAYGDVDRIVAAFRALPEGKPVIVYCYSMPCMTGRKIGEMLAEHGMYVQHLGIGWNEWRHHWTLWNHEHEWDATKVQDYIASGLEPGVPKRDPNYVSPCIEGQFDC